MKVYGYSADNRHVFALWLQVQTEEVKRKTETVVGDLSKVEPAVKEAQQGRHVYVCVGGGEAEGPYFVMMVAQVMRNSRRSSDTL